MKHAKPYLVLAPVLLGGCAVGSYCEGEQDYENAASVPAIQSSDGLQIKASGTALKIPPAPGTRVPYGEKVVDVEGEETVRCLDQPPALPPGAAAAAEPPAEAVPAATPPQPD